MHDLVDAFPLFLGSCVSFSFDGEIRVGECTVWVAEGGSPLGTWRPI